MGGIICVGAPFGGYRAGLDEFDLGHMFGVRAHSNMGTRGGPRAWLGMRNSRGGIWVTGGVYQLSVRAKQSCGGKEGRNGGMRFQ